MLYAIGVLGVCVITSVAMLLVLGLHAGDDSLTAREAGLFILLASTITLVVIGGGTLYKLVELRKGGKVIAERLGGRLLHRDALDSNERVLVNVVDEMAIASGVPSPPIYFMERERSINAFAAGYAPDDAVIGITRGAVESLTRDELQGVIAHEFSHILNGDMRLNIRLIGVLHGLMMLTYLGYALIRAGFLGNVSGMARSRSGRGKDNGAPHVLIFGIVLLVIGACGTAIGSLIKSSVSRQREYLADASAVQFTRNPDGIGGALKRILAMSRVSRVDAHLKSEHAPEAEHMLFADGVKLGLTSFFATHPPLEARIRAIEPSWDGSLGQRLRAAEETVESRVQNAAKKHAADADRRKKALELLDGGIAAGGTVSAGSLLNESGALTPAAKQDAASIFAALSDSLRDAARSQVTAGWVIIGALLAHTNSSDAERFIADALSRQSQEKQALIKPVLSEAVRIELPLRLPLIDICLGTLKASEADSHGAFLSLLDDAIRSDNSVDVYEWAIRTHVRGVLVDREVARVKYYGIRRLGPQLSRVLSAIAHVGTSDPAQAKQAFDTSAASLQAEGMEYISRDQTDMRALGQSLAELRTLAPKLKKSLLEACSRVLASDGRITVAEAELFRAVGIALGVPVPLITADRDEELELPGE